MKITKKYKKIATFLIGCLTMITYIFRGLLYLILKGIRLWVKKDGIIDNFNVIGVKRKIKNILILKIKCYNNIKE